jgi:Spy/CpxP family protein refolding chaperone
MSSRLVLKNCLLAGAIASGALAAPAWATADETANNPGAASAQVETGLLDHMRAWLSAFSCCGSKTEAAAGASEQPDKLVYLTPEQREQMRDQIRKQWQSASPEERQKHREEFKERWEAATPEQREQLRDHARDRWEQLSPEQRQQMRQNIEDRSGRAGSPPGR